MGSYRQDCDLKMNLSTSYSIVNANSLKVLGVTLVEKDREIRILWPVLLGDIAQFPCLSSNKKNMKESYLASRFGG
jgi:hypothetical protein